MQVMLSDLKGVSRPRALGTWNGASAVFSSEEKSPMLSHPGVTPGGEDRYTGLVYSWSLLTLSAFVCGRGFSNRRLEPHTAPCFTVISAESRFSRGLRHFFVMSHDACSGLFIWRKVL